MKLVVVVDKNWGIGKKNDLLFRLREDMKRFRLLTTEKVVVMGGNTLLSFPDSKPLKNRTNIVLSDVFTRDDCIVADSLPNLFRILKAYPTDELYVVGGAMFYRTMLPYCDTAYVTKVDADGGAEVFFPNLDREDGWRCTDEGESLTDNGYEIRFTEYQNEKPLPFPEV